MQKVLVGIIFLFASMATADQKEVSVLPFKQWKQKQVIQAKNRVVRVSNRIHLLKKGLYAGGEDVGASVESEVSQASASGMESEASPSARIKKGEKSDSDSMLKSSQSELKKSIEDLQYAKDLSVEDYFEVYLAEFRENSAAIEALADQMTKEEMAELIKVILKRADQKRPLAEERQSAILGVLRSSLNRGTL